MDAGAAQDAPAERFGGDVAVAEGVGHDAVHGGVAFGDVHEGDEQQVEQLVGGGGFGRRRKFTRPRRAQAPPGSERTGPTTTPWVTVKRTAKSPGKRSVKTK